MGNGHTLGEAAGSTSVTVNIQQLPTHIHQAQASSAVGNAFVPSGNLLAKVQGVDAYQPPNNLVGMAPDSITAVGGSQPHNNMMPYLTLNFIIALQGIFPSRN
jgi:microcystin-dependent protein